jgi:hypothetical protein
MPGALTAADRVIIDVRGHGKESITHTVGQHDKKLKVIIKGQ